MNLTACTLVPNHPYKGLIAVEVLNGLKYVVSKETNRIEGDEKNAKENAQYLNVLKRLKTLTAVTITGDGTASIQCGNEVLYRHVFTVFEIKALLLMAQGTRESFIEEPKTFFPLGQQNVAIEQMVNRIVQQAFAEAVQLEEGELKGAIEQTYCVKGLTVDDSSMQSMLFAGIRPTSEKEREAALGERLAHSRQTFLSEGFSFKPANYKSYIDATEGSSFWEYPSEISKVQEEMVVLFNEASQKLAADHFNKKSFAVIEKIELLKGGVCLIRERDSKQGFYRSLKKRELKTLAAMAFWHQTYFDEDHLGCDVVRERRNALAQIVQRILNLKVDDCICVPIKLFKMCYSKMSRIMTRPSGSTVERLTVVDHFKYPLQKGRVIVLTRQTPGST